MSEESLDESYIKLPEDLVAQLKKLEDWEPGTYDNGLGAQDKIMGASVVAWVIARYYMLSVYCDELDLDRRLEEVRSCLRGANRGDLISGEQYLNAAPKILEVVDKDPYIRGRVLSPVCKIEKSSKRDMEFYSDLLKRTEECTIDNACAMIAGYYYALFQQEASMMLNTLMLGYGVEDCLQSTIDEMEELFRKCREDIFAWTDPRPIELLDYESIHDAINGKINALVMYNKLCNRLVELVEKDGDIYIKSEAIPTEV